MEVKKCYSCCEEIKAEAKQCPYCQSYQDPVNRLLRSFTGSVLIGVIVLWILFRFIPGFENDAIYNPKEVLTISDSSIQFKDARCGNQVVILGRISNSGEQFLTDIVFDVEFYNKSGKLIDSVSDTKYDLIVPPGSKKSFKIKGSAGANKDLYASHKIEVVKAEPDKW